MGHYRSSVLNSFWRSNDPTSIVVLGEGSAGKTCFSIRAKEGRFVEQYDPTLYDVHKFKVIVDGREQEVEIQDTAGQDVFYDSVMNEFIQKSHGVVFMYQITSLQSLRELEDKYISRVKQIKKAKLDAVLIANKNDLEGYREVSLADGQALASKYGIPFYEISLKNNETIALTIIEDMIRKIRPLKPAASLDTTLIGGVEGSEKQNWCVRTCYIY